MRRGPRSKSMWSDPRERQAGGPRSSRLPGSGPGGRCSAHKDRTRGRGAEGLRRPRLMPGSTFTYNETGRRAEGGEARARAPLPEPAEPHASRGLWRVGRICRHGPHLDPVGLGGAQHLDFSFRSRYSALCPLVVGGARRGRPGLSRRRVSRGRQRFGWRDRPAGQSLPEEAGEQGWYLG